MKRSQFKAFICGMLATVLLLACGTVTFAANGGNISVGSAGVLINRMSVVEPGDKVTNANGKEIPATIVYTDEMGGGNTYLPIRTISEMLDIPVTWENGNIYLGLKPDTEAPPTITVFNPSNPDDPDDQSKPGDSAVTARTQVGFKAGPYTEIEPYWPDDSQVDGCMLENIRMRQTTSVGGAIDPLLNQGGYFSISITNNTQYPMIFSLVSVSTITKDPFPVTTVPAGETVIRTFQVDACKNPMGQPNLEYSLHFAPFTIPSRTEADITLSVTGFQK